MKEFLEFIQKEWSAITAAPLIFATFSVLVAGLVYAVLNWRYEGIIQQLRERLAAKDEQIESYRERLQLVPARGSSLSRLTHGELQKEALFFVARLREWLAKWNRDMTMRGHSEWQARINAKDEEESQAVWAAHGASLVRWATDSVAEYDEKFKVEAIVFRDEMRARIVNPDISRVDQDIYELPTNLLGMRMVADDLENLARQLQ